MNNNNHSLLEIKELHINFYTFEGVAHVINGLSLKIEKGEIVGIVGESGCGKSVTAQSVIRILSSPPAEVVSGEIIFNGKDLLSLPEKEMQRIRGDKIAMIFQEPMTSLNPVFTIGGQIAEPLIIHKGISKKEAYHYALEMLKKVSIPSPEQRLKEYPHQLSGGMRQRAMIAMALSTNPSLLIADEPTTALDVTIQAQVLELISNLSRENNTSVIFITHNLGIVAQISDKVAVIYLGKVVEEAKTRDIFRKPFHPYTEGLLKAVPVLHKFDTKGKPLFEIPGSVGTPYEIPSGCAFHPRCFKKNKKCEELTPPLIEIEEDHKVACWLYM